LLAVGYSLAQEILGKGRRGPALKPLRRLEDVEPAQANEAEPPMRDAAGAEGKLPTAD